MKKTLLATAIVTLALVGCNGSQNVKPKEASAHDKHWDYGSHNGPAHWEEFSKTCGKGIHQSPINIIPGKTMSMNHEYDLSMHDDITGMAKVIDNGHSIKVTPEHGGAITLHGEDFNLLQFHFHGKSEHTIDGKRFDMVAHMVHQNPKTEQLAVVAVFFEAGEKSVVLEKIINNVGSTVKIDPQDFMPLDTSHYYHYIGSLTTPPCSENVQWYLLKKPITASKEQIEHFRKFYVDNERPVQELHDRKVEAN
ncbi:carbonate dehydratase [Sulfurimonas aquatica]|uniref:carbonic anhydrase n=1 Tax=Sulfurimonas aquatica TaxID=2672570 RepID=A0A975GDN9_9BACT|nr:carbonic anhydrase family protein [Sulfurimonas aquatica]QSZ42787.1 carbonate dehydratase [Sulfurimonas aquatica]